MVYRDQADVDHRQGRCVHCGFPRPCRCEADARDRRRLCWIRLTRYRHLRHPDGRTHWVQKEVVVQGWANGDGTGWYVPFNCSVWQAEGTRDDDYFMGSGHEADAHNTSLFTCRHCGDWLKADDDGYGTMDGHCGCKKREEECPF